MFTVPFLVITIDCSNLDANEPYTLQLVYMSLMSFLCVFDSTSPGQIARNDYVGSKVKGMCNFARVVDIYIPNGNGRGWPFPLETYQQTILSNFWVFASLIDEKCYLSVLFTSVN